MLFLCIRGANVRVFLENWHFLPILAIFATIKNFYFQKSKCVHHPRTRHHLCAKFTFLSLLSPEISYGEKKSSNHPDKCSAYFAIREPQFSDLKT